MPWFLDDTLHNPYTLGSVLTSPDTLVFTMREAGMVSPSGIMWAHAITPGFHAGCSIAIWNRSAFRRITEVRNTITAVFRAKDLHRMFALVALPNTLAHRFVKRLGFQVEGHAREGLCYRGTWTDAVIYGLLRSDVEAWNHGAATA